MDTLVSQTFQTTDSQLNHTPKYDIGKRELLRIPKEDSKKEDFLHKTKRDWAKFCYWDHYFVGFSNVTILLVSSSATAASDPVFNMSCQNESCLHCQAQILCMLWFLLVLTEGSLDTEHNLTLNIILRIRQLKVRPWSTQLHITNVLCGYEPLVLTSSYQSCKSRVFPLCKNSAVQKTL